MRTATLSESVLPELGSFQPAWPGRTRIIEGRGVFVRDIPGPAGGGEPAVYVHGLGGSSTNWTDFAGLLAGQLDGEAPDLPGFGRSDPAARRNYSMTTHARTVIRLIEGGGRGPVHLFGNSMGGLVSLLIAARRPDLVRTLTLISPAVPIYRPAPGTDLRLGLLLLPGLGGLVSRRLAAIPPEERARGVRDLVFGDPSVVSPERLAEAAREVAERQDVPWMGEALIRSLRGIAAAFVTTGPTNPWRLAATVRAPSLVIWGDRDRLVDARIAPRLARTLPDSRLLMLPGVGHVAQLERPETTARAVLSLLDEVADRRRR